MGFGRFLGMGTILTNSSTKKAPETPSRSFESTEIPGLLDKLAKEIRTRQMSLTDAQVGALLMIDQPQVRRVLNAANQIRHLFIVHFQEEGSRCPTFVDLVQ